MGQILSNSHVQTEDRQQDEGTSESAPRTDASQRVEHLIEQLKLRSAELEEANRELRRISQYRSLFLARMSHELRTPLTSILGFSEILLEQEELTETQRRFCQKIQISGFQLQTSLSQLVNLSRLEAEQPEVFLQEFSLREMLRESCAALGRAAQMQQVHLEYDLAPDVTTIVSDQGKLQQILYNFLAWAVSRSSAGQEVSIYADLIEAALLRIRIDGGEAPAELSRVFDPGESSGGREPNLNELGILISHRLLDVINGNVTLQNRDGGGLRVLIQLPARPTKG